MAECRDCGQHIVFMQLVNGKWAPYSDHFRSVDHLNATRKPKQEAPAPKPLTEAEARAELDERFAEMQQQGAVE